MSSLDFLPQVIAALLLVESGAPGNSDGGRAQGPLQIHQGIVDDVNRVYQQSFTLVDVLNVDRAKMICRLYLSHWVAKARDKVNRYNAAMALAHQATNDISNAELAVRIWNGGPDGWRKGATKDYAQRVLNLIEAESAKCKVQSAKRKERCAMSKSASRKRKSAEQADEECTCQKCRQKFDYRLNLNSDGERLCDVCHERLNMGTAL